MSISSPDYIVMSSISEIFPALIPIFYYSLKNSKCSLPVSIGIMAGYFGLAFPIAFYMIPFWSASMLNIFIFSLVYLAAGVVLTLIFVNQPFSVTIFVALLIRNYCDICRLLASLVYLYTGQAVTGRPIGEPGYVVTVILISFATLPLLLRYLNTTTAYGLKTRGLKFWKYMWMVPLSFYCMFRLAVYPDFIALLDSNGPHMLLFPISYVAGVFLTYLILLQVMDALVNYEEARMNLQTLEAIVDVQDRSYQTMIQNIKKLHHMRHDIRHHLLAISGMAESGENKKMKLYIDSLLNEPSISSPLVFCENSAINSVLSYYYYQAKEAHIPFQWKVNLPGSLPIFEPHICNILGNLLVNAMEACQRQTSGERYIKLTMDMASDSIIIIQTVNTYDHQIRRKGDLFFSSKTSRPGIGTASIRHIAKQYDGVCTFDHDGHLFTAKILLNAGLNKSAQPE